MKNTYFDIYQQIKKILKRVKYFFIINVENKPGYLQADLQKIPLLPNIEHYTIKEIDNDNDEELLQWIDIINEGYGKENDFYDLTKAKSYLKNHLFLDNITTYFLIDKDEPIATISSGKYRDAPHVGGLTRIAVRNKYKGKGLGKYLYLYAFHKMRDSGISYSEMIINMKRDKSIMISYSCGFKPQHNMKYISYKGALPNINEIQKLRIRFRLNRLYRRYETMEMEKIKAGISGK